MNVRGLQRLSVLFVALLIGAGLFQLGTAYGAQLPARSIEISSSTAGAAATYTVQFTIPQPETLGSVRLNFCAESPVIGQPCSLPPGMSISGASLSSQTGGANMSILSTSGTAIILTRPPASIGPGIRSFTFTGITNPNYDGSFFGRIQTYASANATASASDYGGIAMDINESVQVSATVPPYLYFCVGISVTGTDCSTVTGDYIDLGTFTTAVASVAQTQMVAGTNYDSGYVIQASGTTLTSGNNEIPGLATPDVSRPGTSQFGMNLVPNSDPAVGQAAAGSGIGHAAPGYDIQNRYKFVDGDTVALAPVPDEARRYTTSYVTNISKDQAPGVYVTTLTYVATASF